MDQRKAGKTEEEENEGRAGEIRAEMAMVKWGRVSGLECVTCLIWNESEAIGDAKCEIRVSASWSRAADLRREKMARRKNKA